jgi:hypothetical protein
MGGGSELEELQADLEMLARREEAGEELPTVPLGTDPDAVPLTDEEPPADTDSAPSPGENRPS